jgi:hypothetical protein
VALAPATTALVRRLRLRFRPPPARQYLLLYLYAEQDRYPHSRRAWMQIVGEFPRAQRTAIAIDNWARQPYERRLANGLIELSGDNRAWEFSGWQRGLDWAREQGIEHDMVVCVNDAFLNQAPEGYDVEYFRALLNPRTLAEVHRGAIGVTGAGIGPQTLLGHHIRWWIRTNAFAVDAAVLARVPFAAIDESNVDEWLARRWEGRILAPTAPAGESTEAALTLYFSTMYRHAAPIDESTWPTFRPKAMAVLNQSLLTARLAEAGARMYAPGPLSVRTGAMGVRPFQARSDGQPVDLRGG